MKILRMSTVDEVVKTLQAEIKCCSCHCRCLADSGG